MYNLSHIIIQYGHPSHDPIPSFESIRTLFYYEFVDMLQFRARLALH